MISLPDEEQEVFYRDWRILAQDYLLVGKINQEPGSQLVQVQYEFFDVNREIKLLVRFLQEVLLNCEISDIQSVTWFLSKSQVCRALYLATALHCFRGRRPWVISF